MKTRFISLPYDLEYNAIWRDQTAWRVFQYILWHVDYSTGKGTFGRKQIAQGTGLKESTAYKALNRVTTKYQLSNSESNNQYTTISVLNWANYRPISDKVTTSVNESSQDGNTIKTITKEKRYINISKKESLEHQTTGNTTENDNSVTVGNTLTVAEKEEKTSKNSLTPCTEMELWQVAVKKQISIPDCKRTHEAILNQIAAKEFKHKTVYYTLLNWIDLGLQRGTIQLANEVVIMSYPLENPEYKSKKVKILAEMKERGTL